MHVRKKCLIIKKNEWNGNALVLTLVKRKNSHSE